MMAAPLVLLAAGGTGGHLFPAEALGAVLMKRGYRVRLVTDDRAVRYSGLFSRDMIDVVPSEAVSGRTPLSLAQQVREEDMARVRAVYDLLMIQVELAPFFNDLPARLAASHLVVSRSGAGTVAELAAIGRPSILIPLPGAIDQDQFATAGVLVDAGGAIRLPH